jgi:hypothetical protein
MTDLHVQIAGETRRARPDKARSVAIHLDFSDRQPNHFSAPSATAHTWSCGDFVGDTRRGGSCNVRHVTLVPHCNGTHTETIAHVTNEQRFPGQCKIPPWIPCTLITVRPTSTTEDTYTPALGPSDRVIDAATLARAMAPWGTACREALVIRTLPNPPEKVSWHYGPDREPAFFTHQAMELINDWGVQHLVVDLPSIDRMHDEGHLSNHRLFWQLPAEGHDCPVHAGHDKTITELAFVENDMHDGHFLLNLQFADWATDAVPSRPVLIPLEP